MDDKIKENDPLQGNGYYVDEDALAEEFLRPPTLADIEFDKELDEYLAAQQEKRRKAKEEKKAESENRGNDVRK